jgi:hypothetical protein
MPPIPPRLAPALAALVAAFVAACAPPSPEPADPAPPMTALPVTAAPAAPAPEATPAVAQPRLIGRGFAQVSGQPGRTLGEKRLLAMRAARLEAARDLAEQVHGIRLGSDTLVRDAVVQDDRLAASLAITLRGARTLSIQPRGEDGYEVTMALDAASLALVMRMLRAGA